MNDHEASTTGSGEPFFRVPPVVIATVALLVSLHALLVIGGPGWQVASLYLFSFIPARLGGPELYPAMPGSQIWSFVSYAFLHGGWLHLLSNCLWLTVFGTVVARRLYLWRFAVLFVASAIGGAAAMLALHWGEPIMLIGASGSVSGLMAAAIPLMYARGATLADMQSSDLRKLRILSPSELASDPRALFFAAVWFGATLLTGAAGGWLSNSFADADSIAWEAHIGGFVTGLAVFYLLDMQRDLPEAVS